MNVKPELHPAAFIYCAPCRKLPVMAGRRIYFREWRAHRGLTQRQVVDRLLAFDDPHIPTIEASLSRIETGKQIYNQRILEALADIYQCEPEHLISRDPTKEGELIDFLAPYTDRQLQRAYAVLKALDAEAATK